ncbi:MAG TPA: hypothetical protein VEF76_08110 [Patescibacteria group bacterium]|nr:hypothetical protein [Patescibacteria group bacterium]
MPTKKTSASKSRKPAARSRKPANHKTASRKTAAVSSRRAPAMPMQARPGIFASMSLLAMLADIFGVHRS